MADQAAKQAATASNNQIHTPLPVTHRNNLIDEYFRLKWEDRWSRTPTSKHTKLFLPQLQTESQVKKTVSLTKLDLTKYIKTITIFNLNATLKLILSVDFVEKPTKLLITS